MPKRILGILFVLAVFALSSCSSGIPEEDYEAAVSRGNSLQAELDVLQAEAGVLQAGVNSLEIELNSLQGEKEGLQGELGNLGREFADIQSELNSVKGELNLTLEEKTVIQGEYDALMYEAADFFTLTQTERESALEVARREREISTLDARIASLNTQIDGLNTQIEGLQADVVRIAGQSRAFPAGFFTAGEDFEVGRYRIYGGSSNFFVRDRNDRGRINIIFGTGSGRVSEYIYRFALGDVIESRSPFRMVPIE